MPSKVICTASTAGELKKALEKVPDYVPIRCEDCAQVQLVANADAGESLFVSVTPYDSDVDEFESVEN